MTQYEKQNYENIAKIEKSLAKIANTFEQFVNMLYEGDARIRNI